MRRQGGLRWSKLPFAYVPETLIPATLRPVGLRHVRRPENNVVPIRAVAPTFLFRRFRCLAISLSPYYLFFFCNKKLFFCHSSMSCYPREHKTRDIAHPGTKREITDDIVTTYSFRTGAESGIYGSGVGRHHYSILAFNGRELGKEVDSLAQRFNQPIRITKSFRSIRGTMNRT